MSELVNQEKVGVKVIGYIGSLGQYEDLIIPTSITWNGSTYPVNAIEIKMSEYKEPMDLLTGVEIPSSIHVIKGASFSGAGNLVRVTFKGINTTTITTASGFIEEYCFRGMNSGIHYYNATGETITNIRA